MNELKWFLTGSMFVLCIISYLHQNRTIQFHQNYFQMTFPGDEHPIYWHLYTCHAYPSAMETTINDMSEGGAISIAKWRFESDKVSFDNVQCVQQEYYK